MTVSVGIHDGRTKDIDSFLDLKKSVCKGKKDAEQTLQIDDFIFQGMEFNGKLNECLKEWKNFSTCQYVINTLCERIFYSGSGEVLERLYREIETAPVLSEESEELLDTLCDALMQKVEEIGTGELREELAAKYPRDVIRDNLLELQEDFFFDFFAPVLELGLDEINFFLVRVLKRDQLCGYVPKEYLLELAVNVSGKLHVSGTAEVLFELKKYYCSIDSETAEEELPSDNGTRYIAEKTGAGIQELSARGSEFKISDYPEIQRIIKWYKGLERPSRRDREKAYEPLFFRMSVLYHTEIKDYQKLLKAEEVEAKKEGSLSLPITVQYVKAETEAETKIKKETEFYGERCRFHILKDIELPQEDYRQICIHVLPLPENKKYPKPKSKWVPMGAELQIVAGNAERDGKPVVRNVHTANIKDIAPNLNSQKWTRPLWFADPKGKGFVVLDILCGEKLPEGLCFEYSGFCFTPSISKDAKDIRYEHEITFSAYLDVSSIQAERVLRSNKEKTFTFEESWSVTRMEPAMKCVLDVSNTDNYLTAPQDLFTSTFQLCDEKIEINVDEELAKMPDWQLFSEYMYSDRDFDAVSGLDISLGKKIGLDISSVASAWMKDSMITGDPRWFSGLPQHRQRSVVLALLFLIYIKENAEMLITEGKERFVRNFRSYVDRNMEEFRFDGLYLGYPFDCLLVFLLAVCECLDMADTLRVLYKEIVRREDTDE